MADEKCISQAYVKRIPIGYNPDLPPACLNLKRCVTFECSNDPFEDNKIMSVYIEGDGSDINKGGVYDLIKTAMMYGWKIDACSHDGKYSTNKNVDSVSAG